MNLLWELPTSRISPSVIHHLQWYTSYMRNLTVKSLFPVTRITTWWSIIIWSQLSWGCPNLAHIPGDPCLRCRRSAQSPAPSKAAQMTAVMFSKCCKFTVSGISLYFSSFLLVEMVSSLLRVTHKTLGIWGFWGVFFVCFFHGEGWVLTLPL